MDGEIQTRWLTDFPAAGYQFRCPFAHATNLFANSQLLL